VCLSSLSPQAVFGSIWHPQGVRTVTYKSSLVALLVVVAIGALAALVLAVGPSVGDLKPASARTSTDNAAAAPADKGKMAKYCDTFVGHLGSNLGKSPDEVKKAVIDAANQTLEDAVTNGDMTRAQADKIKAEITASGGNCDALSKLHAGAGASALDNNAELGSYSVDAASTALHMTPAAFKKEIAAGHTLHQMADSQGVSKEAFKASVKTAASSKLKELVSKGTLTQAQADRFLTMADAFVDSSWDGNPWASRKPPSTTP
jgi:hypothetical protein